MNINPPANKSFKAVNLSQKRYIVMKGSAGSGKSVDTAQNYILRLMRDKGRNLVCIRKADITNRDSTFAELTGAIYRMFGDKAERYWKINTSPLQLTFIHNGNKIIFRGMNDDKQREKLKSITFQKGKLTDVWIEEATEITQADFEIIDDRLRGQLPDGQFYQIRMTFNPVNKNHWIKKNFFDFTVKDFANDINVNLIGTFAAIRTLCEIMKPGSTILNMLSVHYEQPRLNKYAYDASKAGIAMLTKEAALVLAEKGITVNAISYGAVRTPMNRDWIEHPEHMEQAKEKIMESIDNYKK
jgi:NAD(P)-dependent dehydrogenase (short-subunit alcohol dehydrogenase family)